MAEAPLTELEKMRRVLIVIQSAALNFGYFRGAKTMTHEEVEVELTDIQRRTDNNFLDMGVFDWCKLFAEREHQYWGRFISTDKRDAFAEGLFKAVGKDDVAWKSYVEEFLVYRDKFLGHLDNRRTAAIPRLDSAIKALHYYAQFILANHELAEALSTHEFDIVTLVGTASTNAQRYLR